MRSSMASGYSSANIASSRTTDPTALQSSDVVSNRIQHRLRHRCHGTVGAKDMSQGVGHLADGRIRGESILQGIQYIVEATSRVLKLSQRPFDRRPVSLNP